MGFTRQVFCNKRKVLFSIEQAFHFIGLDDPFTSTPISQPHKTNDILNFQLSRSNEERLEVLTVKLNIVEGISLHVFDLYKLVERLEQKVRKLPWERNSKTHKKIKLYCDRPFSRYLTKFLNVKKGRQNLVFRFDLAHVGGAEDQRIIKMLSFGTRDRFRSNIDFYPKQE